MSIKEGTVFQDTDTGRWLITEKTKLLDDGCKNCFYFETNKPFCEYSDYCTGIIFRKIRKNEFLPTWILPPCNMFIFVLVDGQVVIVDYDAETDNHPLSEYGQGWRPIDYPKLKE